MKWLGKGAEAGYPLAQCESGYKHENPMNREPANMPEAVRWYRLAAGQGNAWGQFYLGRCYLESRGVEWSEEKALELMRQAADQDNAQALFKLAELYARGIGEPRDASDRPMRLLQRAARAGCERAYEVIVLRYQCGVGCERDLVAAAEWYCRAALVGVGRFSLEDNRKPTGYAESFQPLPERSRILIRQPYIDATDSLALLEALSLYKAASRDESRSMLQLGQKYVAGSDVPKNPARAWLWFTLAARNGASEARARLSGVEAEMTASELTETKRLLPGLAQELKEVASALR
jgi:TPR repeat protein